MKHKLIVKISKTPENGIVAMKKIKVRNNLFKRLFSSTTRPILILGDTVKGITIEEVPESN